MKKSSFLLLKLAIVYLVLLNSCKTEPTSTSPIQNPMADSLVLVAIKEAKALPVNSIDQKKATSIINKIILNKNFNLLSDSVQSLSYHTMGVFLYNLAEYDAALSYLDTAIQIRNPETYLFTELDVARSYYVRSFANNKLFKNKNAISDISFANKILEKFPEEKILRGKYYTYTGTYYSNRNEKAKAELYFQQAKELLEPTPNNEEMAEYYSEYGAFLQKQNLSEDAIRAYDQAIAIYKNLPNSEVRSAPIKLNRFDLILKMEPYQVAAPIYTNFLSSFPDSTTNLKNLKRVGHNNLAWESYSNDDLQVSEFNYQKALELATEITKGSHSAILATAHEGLGDVAAKKKKFKESIDHYHRAIRYLCIGFDNPDVLALPDIKKHVIIDESLLERIIGFKTEALADKYKSTGKVEDLEALYATYQGLDDLLIHIRQGYKAAMSRYDLVGKTRPTYEQATQASLQLYEKKKDKKYLESAYNFASKNKAVIMLDGLQDEKAQFAGIPSALLKKENQLKKEIYDLNVDIYELKKLNKEEDSAIKNLKKVRFDKTRKYEDLIKSFEENYPKYYQLKYANNSATDVKEIQKKLSQDVGVLEYFVGDENIYIFNFSASSELHCEIVKKPKNFLKDCVNYRKLIEKDSMTSITEFSKKSFALYDLLIKQPLAHLQASSDIKRLMIVPDDILLQVSFETFFTELLPAESKVQWTDKLPFLLRNYAVSYAYSNKLIFESSVNSRLEKAKNSYVGFGLEYDDYTLEAIKYIQPAQELPQMFRGIGKLMYSDDEVLESAEIMGGKTYINEKATKANFLKEVKNGNILHLVTHGFMSKKSPMNSGLIFTKENEEDDFILRTADLYSMNLSAKMTVLSACHTGGGKIQKGEGIRSLARAFNFAGCPNVTASLWAAPDLSTKKVIVPFYQSLKSGLPKDVSLQNAKLNYLDNCRFNIEALPCNWAHLITIGNIDPIISSN